jgi:hypothetical protein
MTIEFNCPQCKALIAFPDQHAGKRARCLTCKQRLIIPAHSGEVPKRVAREPEDKGLPVTGFYRAALLDTWRLFLKLENLHGLIFIAAAVSSKFFLGHMDHTIVTPGFNIVLPTGLILTLVTWGGLFWYYLEIIDAATFEGDSLADLTLGDSWFDRGWTLLKSLWVFAFGLLLVQLPYLVWRGLERGLDLSSPKTGQVLSGMGLLLFPMVILTFGVNRDVAMLARVDQMIRPVLKALGPYLLTAVLFALAWHLQMRTQDYGDLKDASMSAVWGYLVAQLAIQVLAIVAMRAIGLFYRHYACHFAW